MQKFYLFFFLLIKLLPSFAQEEGDFPFGAVDIFHLNEKTYSKDSTADAYVVKEFGRAYISEAENTGLVFTYHIKIKILTNKGLEQANIIIPLRKSDNSSETIRDLKAVTINLENGIPQATSLENEKIYTEKVSDYYQRKKFTLPNAKVGSIIEYQYTMDSPFIFNFRNWEFQSDIPKMESDYWAKIPANYSYNIALTGFKKLDKQDSELVKNCFKIGGGVADCSLFKWGMKDIPAFIEEDYMTASKNFLSAIRFELIEIKYFDGRTQRITKSWQDIYKELKLDTDFGIQIKRHSDLFENQILKLKVIHKNQKELAKGVYDTVRDWYRWDDYYGKYAKNGLKKAHETRTGNVGDINLALIGALQYAGINTEPVLISTRENGIPTKLFPVMSEFNYVIAKVNVDNESFLLDATDRDLPFGMLPFRCLNKEGRAIGKDSCYWVNLIPDKKYKQVDFIQLKLDSSGNFTGKITIKTIDYQAFYKRKKIKEFASTDEYIENLDEKNPNLRVKNYTISNLDSLDLPLTEEYEVVINAFDSMDSKTLSINPFIFNKTTENPFKLKDRIYPIDFGAQKDFATVFQLEIPENYQVKLLPASVALKLPENNGRYIFKTEVLSNNLI
ncbi:MAG TPA: DUF3857 domain-containing protein, partial [Pelobium sp.]|nr:DUF3857 domain-containing protein [Pelobium sp.]